ncbi:hypothetical protein [Peribacillus acanthi]|uniref:hypothetical protein n=1 Tax=Peribacillus acanthi TaxID=2171554 RepID=UPI000D3EB59A|nr:hypothetical protein [Peribacillus acanthi]
MRLKTTQIIGLVIIALVIVGNFNAIYNAINKFFVQHTIIESTVIKTLTVHEIDQLETKQEKLAQKYDKTTTEWLHEEIEQGAFLMRRNGYSFLLHNPEYDSAKIKYTVTQYKINGQTVDFISNSIILQVHSEKGWKEYKPD